MLRAKSGMHLLDRDGTLLARSEEALEQRPRHVLLQLQPPLAKPARDRLTIGRGRQSMEGLSERSVHRRSEIGRADGLLGQDPRREEHELTPCVRRSVVAVAVFLDRSGLRRRRARVDESRRASGMVDKKYAAHGRRRRRRGSGPLNALLPPDGQRVRRHRVQWRHRVCREEALWTALGVIPTQWEETAELAVCALRFAVARTEEARAAGQHF